MSAWETMNGQSRYLHIYTIFLPYLNTNHTTYTHTTNIHSTFVIIRDYELTIKVASHKHITHTTHTTHIQQSLTHKTNTYKAHTCTLPTPVLVFFFLTDHQRTISKSSKTADYHHNKLEKLNSII